MENRTFELMYCCGGCEGEDMSVADLLAAIQSALAEMPEEVRNEAYVTITAYGDYASAQLEIARPETAAETKAREDDESRRAQRYRDEQHDAELAMYERLKRKFGGA